MYIKLVLDVSGSHDHRGLHPLARRGATSARVSSWNDVWANTMRWNEHWLAGFRTGLAKSSSAASLPVDQYSYFVVDSGVYGAATEEMSY